MNVTVEEIVGAALSLTVSFAVPGFTAVNFDPLTEKTSEFVVVVVRSELAIIA